MIFQTSLKYLICGGGVCEGAGLYKLRFELAAILMEGSTRFVPRPLNPHGPSSTGGLSKWADGSAKISIARRDNTASRQLRGLGEHICLLLFCCVFFFVVVYGDSGCTNTFCISNKDSVIPRLVYLRSIQPTTAVQKWIISYILHIIQESSRQPQGGRGEVWGGGVFILVVTPLLFKKALDFSHLYAKWLGT